MVENKRDRHDEYVWYVLHTYYAPIRIMLKWEWEIRIENRKFILCKTKNDNSSYLWVWLVFMEHISALEIRLNGAMIGKNHMKE